MVKYSNERVPRTVVHKRVGERKMFFVFFFLSYTRYPFVDGNPGDTERERKTE